MKKNKMMRIASVLLVAVILTTCAISGTFAKYVTSDNSSDKARVAKWGVTVTATDDSSFKTEYATDDGSYVGALSVKSSNSDRVVAPGTSGNAIKFSISGTPEVATKVDIDMTINKEINVGGTYYPVKFTLKQTKKVNSSNEVVADDTTLASGTLTEIKNFLDTYTGTAYYAPNAKLDAEFELNWAWEFGDPANNDNDTLLGNVAAGTVTDPNVETKIDYSIIFTVSQVD